MKKPIQLTLLLITLLSFSSIKAHAHDIAVENEDKVTIYYNYSSDGKELEVVGADTKYSGTVVIPPEVTYDGKQFKVTSIGWEAFRYNHKLTSVTIPNSVITIHNYAFPGCSALKTVSIGNSVTSIGECAFYDCDALESLSIGNSVASIGDKAFYNCSSLTSVTIPNSVTYIGNNAFENCI